jgi:hypothetical protein
VNTTLGPLEIDKKAVNAMEKVDFKKALSWLYVPSARSVSLVDVQEMGFLMVDGRGAPESPRYQEAVQALYTLAYTLKFACKKAGGPDYTVMALEGLWWADDYAAFQPETADRNSWQWTMMIMQPDFITGENFKSAVEAARKKKDVTTLGKVRFTRFNEGKAAQLMHIGPYSAEGTNVKKIHAKIDEIGGKLSGKHHEIYLSDPRRADPAKMKTVLRQPYSV